MTVEQISKKDCCGCTACISICPTQAISMQEDEEGFTYPLLDKKRCVQCGLCYKTCTKALDSKRGVLKAYAAKHTDDGVLSKSSSGGVAFALCEYVIHKHGSVYGVEYDPNFRVVTARAKTISECELFFGSKYVQTNEGTCFVSVLQDLTENKLVLFFGTSCHVAGLLSFLKEKKCSTEKLVTVDLICHGVPSPKLFADYIDFINKKETIDCFDFRTKKMPWGYGSKNYGCTITYKDGRQETGTRKAMIYLRLFFSNNCLRPCCASCNYTGADKPADITIADYWGIQEQHPDFYSEKGISAVLAHTEKGIQVIGALEQIDKIPSTLEKIGEKQANMSHPSLESKSRAEFWKLYYAKGFRAIAVSYGGYSWKSRLKETVQSCIRLLK